METDSFWNPRPTGNALDWVLAKRMSQISEGKLERSSCVARLIFAVTLIQKCIVCRRKNVIAWAQTWAQTAVWYFPVAVFMCARSHRRPWWYNLADCWLVSWQGTQWTTLEFMSPHQLDCSRMWGAFHHDLMMQSSSFNGTLTVSTGMAFS